MRVIELVLGDFRMDLLEYHRRGFASGETERLETLSAYSFNYYLGD